MTIHVLLSGGLDSTAVLATALSTPTEPEPVVAVGFDYNQRHSRELNAAFNICAHYHVGFTVVPLVGLLGADTTNGGALLGHKAVPHGRYDHPSMADTVVPGRNLLFVAATVARAERGDSVWLGVHAGDHPIYPDCRGGFIATLNYATTAGYGVALVAPFLNNTKADIVTAATALNAPIGLTWSCYEGGLDHCGRCGTCVERAEAFHTAGVPDPTTYQVTPDWSVAR